MTTTIPPTPAPTAPLEASTASRDIDSLPRLVVVTAGVVASSVSVVAGLGLAVSLLAVVLAAMWVLRERRDLLVLLFAAATLLPWLVIRHNHYFAVAAPASVLGILAFAAMASGTSQPVTNFSLAGCLAWPTGRSQRLLDQASREPKAASVVSGGFTRMFVGCVVASPIVALFWALLASADPVFAEIFTPSHLPFGRFVLFFLAAPTIMVVLRFALSRRHVATGAMTRRLGSVEANVVLALVNALFLLFVIVRFSASRELPPTDDAFRATVRSGFFQLLAVAVLTIVLLCGLRKYVRRDADHQRRFLGLSLTAVVLAGLIDVIALMNIAEYVELNFNSPLRYWSFGFGVMLFAAFGALGLRLVGVHPDKAWFAVTLIGIWLVFLQVMVVSNPDRRIAEFNFAHPQTSPQGEVVIAANPLIWLSDDAADIIVANIGVLEPMSLQRYDRVRTHLCAQKPIESWREWNRARSVGETHRDELCRGSS